LQNIIELPGASLRDLLQNSVSSVRTFSIKSKKDLLKGEKSYKKVKIMLNSLKSFFILIQAIIP
jgi:hypothetical protein